MCFCGLEMGRRASRKDRQSANRACEMLPGAHNLSLGKLKLSLFNYFNYGSDRPKSLHLKSGKQSYALKLRRHRPLRYSWRQCDRELIQG